ncbi:hypothetical protein OCA16_26055 [Bacillus cereus]|nr:hypothetical protein [Bacillus cereus]
MRHTRNRQLAKAHKDPVWMWTIEPTDRIDKQRYWMTMGLQPKLDKSFKWHREKGSVSYRICDEYESYLSIHSNRI